MTEYSVGKEILSLCGKCKLALYHLIVVMKDTGVPGRVECGTCKNVHVYKDPEAAAKKKAKKKSTRGRKPKVPEIPVAEAWKIALTAAEGEFSKYSIKTEFALGDLIDHPKFGQGLVEKVQDGDKIEVIFEDDIKLLVHNR